MVKVTDCGLACTVFPKLFPSDCQLSWLLVWHSANTIPRQTSGFSCCVHKCSWVKPGRLQRQQPDCPNLTPKPIPVRWGCRTPKSFKWPTFFNKDQRRNGILNTFKPNIALFAWFGLRTRQANILAWSLAVLLQYTAVLQAGTKHWFFWTDCPHSQ